MPEKTPKDKVSASPTRRKGVPSVKMIATSMEERIEAGEVEPAVLGAAYFEDDLRGTCWGCENPGGKDQLSRCHIFPASAQKAGDTPKGFDVNAPDNFFLLCDSCHKEQPDYILNVEVQLEWLKTRVHYMERQTLMRSVYAGKGVIWYHVIEMAYKELGELTEKDYLGVYSGMQEDILGSIKTTKSAAAHHTNFMANCQWKLIEFLLKKSFRLLGEKRAREIFDMVKEREDAITMENNMRRVERETKRKEG